MQQKFLKIGSLALLQIVIVGNLQTLPANAIYGAALPLLYALAVIGFFIPCILMVAELATTRPQTGGAYIWCEQAFGAKIGFFTVCILWISNLLWYPTIFSLVAVNFAYLVNAALAQNKIFIISFSVFAFWLFTGLNCLGIKFSSRVSAICSILGIIIPILLIIAGGVNWYLTAKPMAIAFNKQTLFPNLIHLTNIGLLVAIMSSLFGMELTAVHAGNVVNPRRDYPKSLFISGVLLVALLLLSELSIAMIIPAEKLNLLTGVLDATIVLLQKLHLANFIFWVLLLILIGNIGSIAAWMLGSTRGMFVACQKNNITTFLQKVNQREAPVGVLIFEAIIFAIVSSVFLIFPRVTDSFWLLLDLASQITFIYYIILFATAIRLRSPASVPMELRRGETREGKSVTANGFVIPGGNAVLWIIMLLGSLTCLLGFLVGLIPPDNLDKHNIYLFHLITYCGLFISICVPFLLWSGGKHSKYHGSS